MRIALGLDVDGAPSFAAVVPLEPHARPRIVPASALGAPASGRIDAIVDAAVEAIAVVTEREAEAPSAVALVHPLAWDAGQVLRLHRALSRAGLHEFGVLSSAVAVAVGVDSRHPALDGHRVTVVALRPNGAEVQGLRKDGKNSFSELAARVSVDGVPETQLDAALLELVDAQLAKKLPSRVDDPALRSAFETLDASIRVAREKLNYEDSAIVGVQLPGRAAVIQVQRDAFQQAVTPAIRATIPALAAAIRAASAEGPPAQQLILTGTSAPAPLLADLLRAELGVPIIVAGPRDGGSFGGALVAAATAPEPAPLSMASSTEPVSVFAEPHDSNLPDEFADDPDPATEKKRRPLTLLQLWPITAAAAVLVALAGTASSGALDLTPAGSHPTTGTTAPADRGTGSATDSGDGDSGVAQQTPQPTASVPAGSSDADGGTSPKKNKKPAPTTNPVPPVVPVIPTSPSATPTPTPDPTDTSTPTPDPTPSDTSTPPPSP
jgi:hypothetical protein